MKKLSIIVLTALSLNAGGMFAVGHKNVSFSAGASSAYGNDYTVIGVNAHYFITNEVSVGIGYQGWFGSDPGITELSIPVTYYLPLESATFTPYVGGIYRHTFIDDPYDGYDVYGGRVGVAIRQGSNGYMAIGWVQEYLEGADGTDDSRGYPEISVGFSF